MKKIISMMLVTAMLLCAAVSVSAAGEIYMQDTFDTLDPDKWMVDVSRFYIEDGWLVGDHNAVVHQSLYDVEPDDESGRVNMTWNECYVSVDIRLNDYSKVLDDYGAGLWWKDYRLAPGEGWCEGFEYTKGATYSLTLHTETNRVALWGDYQELENSDNTDLDEEEEGEVREEEKEEEKLLAEIVLPEDVLKVDFADPCIVNLGMEITSTGISAFLDGVHLFTWNSPTLLAQNKASPILLLNEGLIVGFDNFIVTSLDWNGVPEKNSSLVVGNYSDDREVAIVINRIDSLGAITSPAQRTDVKSVRNVYDDLSYEQQMLVHNSGVLAKAEFELEKYYTLKTGDYDGDGIVNVLDAIFLAKKIVIGNTAPVEGAILDYNADGNVNILDAVDIVNEIVG